MDNHAVVRQVTVINPQGLHARPAHAIVTLASQFRSRIELQRDGECADAKSILAVLTLAAVQGSQLTVRATGDDAGPAVEALSGLFATGFGENGEQPADDPTRASGQPSCLRSANSSLGPTATARPPG
jgi:phosphotransferase system HPr (HPr) family protein